jgi:hypothetical protein
MTDQQTPDLSALTAAVDEFGKNLLSAARIAGARIKAALDAVQDEYVLAPNDVDDDDSAAGPTGRDRDITMRLAAKLAFNACLDQADDRVPRILGNLDAAQLYAVEAAGSGLAIHASERRACIAHAHDCGEPSCVCRDLGTAQAETDEQPDDLDLPALNDAIAEAIVRWHDTTPDIAGELAGVRAAVDPMLFGLRDRARSAEATNRNLVADLVKAREQRDAHAHLIEHWADEHIVLKTVSGPDVHASWCYRCGIERAEAARDAADTRARSAIEQRDHYREAADQCRAAYRDELAKRREAEKLLAGARAQVERWRYVQNRQSAAHEIGPILGIDPRDRTNDPDAWRP